METMEVRCEQKSECLYHYSCAEKGVSELADVTASTLVIIFGWYGAKRSSIEKYRMLYHRRGFDVLFVVGKALHFAWPPNAVSFVKDINAFLETGCSHYQFYIVHAFSIGAYIFTHCMQLAAAQPQTYGNIVRKCVGIVYDSLTIGGINKMLNGLATGITKNRFKQAVIKSLISLYLFITKTKTVDSHENSTEFFKGSPLKVQTLVFSCLNDPMSSSEVVSAMLTQWKDMGVLVQHKSWTTSAHASHLRLHRQEYTLELDNFLELVLLQIRSKSEHLKNKLFKSKL